MALTQSNMFPLGSKAPDFTLTDVVSQKKMTLSQQSPAKATLIMFICNHCPYVKHIIGKLVSVAGHYRQLGVAVYSICSNDAEAYVADNPANMSQFAVQHHFSFPYLYDETQQVAINYDAACTPDFYIFDEQLLLAYRGRFDQATPGNTSEVTGHDLCQAIDALLAGEPISPHQFPSIGCNIKWKNQ